MSKDKSEHTPEENVAAENVAAEEATKAAKPKKNFSLSTGAIIGLSAAGLAVIVGAGFGGAAIAEGIDHHRRGDRDHSMFDQNGQQGGFGQGQMGGHHKRGQFGQQGQMGQQGQLPNGGQMPNRQNVPVPGAPTNPNGTVTPQNLPQPPAPPQGTDPQALGGGQAPHGFTGGS